jgi:hypothetical protein
MTVRDHWQELWEMGLGPAAFRVGWELRSRLPVVTPHVKVPRVADDGQAWTTRLPFEDPAVVADAMRDRVPKANLDALHDVAQQATRGKILCFGHSVGNYGDPIDWFLDPTTGVRWSETARGATSLSSGPNAGDVKLVWELTRFPHAYHLARAAAFHPESAEGFACALTAQVEAFAASSEPGCGVHWSSGQEIAIRMLACTFALDTLLARSAEAGRAARRVSAMLVASAAHIEASLDYARRAVNNNHLISEALGLYLAGVLLPQVEGARRWRTLGRTILDQEARRQFYPDGAYLNLSHNYHRNVLQLLVAASLIARAGGDGPCASWLSAMDRSLEFLLMHQNPADGRLPNFGPNDGSNPMPLATTDFSDFRPMLQTLAALVRGERLYVAGPWDEAVAWTLGPTALDLPLRPPRCTSRSFSHTGFHVLRDKDEHTFATFRCGSLLDRHGQIDMLHVDVWWRGLNVAVDGGTYLYNGPEAWHRHFTGTGSHNTLTVDGRDQMLHFRKFRYLYRTKAKLLSFDVRDGATLCAGQHYGYARHPGACVHRRAILATGGLVVVVDRVTGEGDHDVRLQWLFGPFGVRQTDARASVTLDTPEGQYTARAYDASARLLEGTVVAGQLDPPRGWLSRYYADKVAAPSLAVQARCSLPLTWITVLGPGDVVLEKEGDLFTAGCDGVRASFRIVEGLVVLVERS